MRWEKFFVCPEELHGEHSASARAPRVSSLPTLRQTRFASFQTWVPGNKRVGHSIAEAGHGAQPLRGRWGDIWTQAGFGALNRKQPFVSLARTSLRALPRRSCFYGGYGE